MAIEPGTRELIGIAAAIAGKCGPCFNCHYEEAVRLGVPDADILEVIEFAREIRAAGDRHSDKAAAKKMQRRAKDAGSQNVSNCKRMEEKRACR
jgi:AhpD family alkylhydroperoxidase